MLPTERVEDVDVPGVMLSMPTIMTIMSAGKDLFSVRRLDLSRLVAVLEQHFDGPLPILRLHVEKRPDAFGLEYKTADIFIRLDMVIDFRGRQRLFQRCRML